MQLIKPAKLLLLMAVFAVATVPFVAEASWWNCVPWSGGGSSYSAAMPAYGEPGYEYGGGYGYGNYGYSGQPESVQVRTKTSRSKNQSPKSKPSN